MRGLSPDFTHKVKAEARFNPVYMIPSCFGFGCATATARATRLTKKYCHEQTKACSKTGSNS
jgi:hypothetical protein